MPSGIPGIWSGSPKQPLSGIGRHTIIVTKYNQTLWELLSSSGMAARAQALMTAVKSWLSQTQQVEFKPSTKQQWNTDDTQKRTAIKSMLEQYSGVHRCLMLLTAYYTGKEFGAV